MSDLPGNPYAESHQHRPGVTEDNEHWAIAQATLALAHEQRTATLVSLHQYAADKLIDGHVHGNEEDYVAHLDKLRDKINLRIGVANDEAFRAGS